MQVLMGCASGLVAFYERQEIRPLRRKTSVPPEDLGKYLGTRANLAADLAFRFCSAHRSARYKLVVATWMSNDARLFLMEREGTVFSMPYKRTCFCSRIQGREFLVATDDVPESDLSARTEVEVFMDADLAFLFKAHQDRVVNMPRETIPFDCTTGADVLEDIERTRATQLVKLDRPIRLNLVLQDATPRVGTRADTNYVYIMRAAGHSLQLISSEASDW